MDEYYLDWSSDGCPNNCAYCRDMGYSCIYKDSDSPLRVTPYTCCVCGKKLSGDEAYQYKDNYYCENCFDFN